MINGSIADQSGSFMSSFLFDHQQLENSLRHAGLRPTRQRIELAELLFGDGKDRHLTAEQLYATARAAGKKISRATVYNALRDFAAKGLVHKILVDQDQVYFDTNVSEHQHLYIEDEHRLVDILLNNCSWQSEVELPEDMTLERVDVIFRLRRKA